MADIQAGVLTRGVRRLRRVLMWSGLGIVGYLLLLLVVGWAVGGVVAGEVRDRLAASLDAEAAVGDASVRLVRGGATMRDITVRRERGGTLALELAEVDLDLAPLGAVLWDREPRAVRVRGGRLSVEGLAVLRLPPRPKSPPIRVGALAIDDCVLEVAATGILPGLTRVELTIERARARATVLRTALSWLFTLDELVARVALPGGVAVRLEYRQGVLAASGGPFGDTPVVIPFSIPPLDDADEVEQLASLGKELGKQLALAQARRWLGDDKP